MKITKESYQAYAAPACIATITLISGIPRMVSNFYPGATSKGILTSGLASSAMTFFFTASPEFQHRRDLGLCLSITSIFTCTVGIPFLSKAYVKVMKKTKKIVMTGYFRLGAECAFGVLLSEVMGRYKFFPEPPNGRPRPRRRPPPPPPPKAKPKPKPKPSPGYIHIFPPPKDPPPYSLPKPDPWAWTDEAIARADARIAEQQRNPPAPDYPLPPPAQTYRPPHMWGSMSEDKPLADSWIKITSEEPSEP